MSDERDTEIPYQYRHICLFDLQLANQEMADEWPFLHLNIVSPQVEQLPGPSDNQELSLLPFDPSHLEAWTNITFQFDEPNVLFNPTATTETQNPNSDNPPISHELFHSSPDIQFQLTSDPTFTPFVEATELISNSNKTHQPNCRDRPSNQTSNHSIDAPANNNPSVTTQSSIQTYHQSTNWPKNSKSKQVEDHSSPIKNDPTSPNNQQGSSNDDDADNRIAYDEDKRRRNTLASARFRMKKKMKEQEIERTAREMRDRVSELEKEVDSLKQENKWLRGLIVDSTASKLVSVQAKETAELNRVETHCNNKRANPVLSLTTDSIRIPSYPPQKKLRICSSPTSTIIHSTDTRNFSPPPFSR